MSNTPRLGLPEFEPAQALPETTANEVSRRVEQGASLFIAADKDATSPPGSPAEGDAYIVATAATGTWSGHDGEIAFYQNAAWEFIEPVEGVFAWVLDEAALYHFVSSAWSTYSVGGLGTASTLDFDTDGTLAANSDLRLATQKAVRTYIAAAVTGLFDYKGDIDCSANPNYPAASKGDAYTVSVAGKIGGGSGVSVDIGDTIIAKADNAGGTQASVGASWWVLEHNLAGALLASNNLSDLASPPTALTNLGATTVGGNVVTLANPSAITFLRINADNSVTALSASAFRSAIGAGTGSGSGDLVSTNNLSDVANAATARANLGVDGYRIGLFFTTTPTVSEVIALHVVTDAFTFPANFASPNSKGNCGTNPTASFALDVQKNGVSIGTITISTGGVFTFATASGTSKSIAAGDVIKIVAPSPVDATCANVAVTLRGSI